MESKTLIQMRISLDKYIEKNGYTMFAKIQDNHLSKLESEFENITQQIKILKKERDEHILIGNKLYLLLATIGVPVFVYLNTPIQYLYLKFCCKTKQETPINTDFLTTESFLSFSNSIYEKCDQTEKR